jgi:hypothetical protein
LSVTFRKTPGAKGKMCVHEDRLELVAALGADEYPLVHKYFGRHLAKLLKATQGGPCDTHFAKVALRPYLLEARLQRIEALGQTQRIMSEVGDIDDPKDLDERLQNAWAELRVVDQLRKEGFDSIQKVKVTADLMAQKDEQTLVLQVTRVNKSWRTQVVNHSDSSTSVDHIGYGDIGDIYRRLSPQLHRDLSNKSETCELDNEYGPLSYYFWDAIEDKNCDFKKWTEEDCRRCVVIVSNEEGLQDSMVRHVACRLIREALHNWLSAIHFEELLWLPDAGNGAWFKVGATIEETQCFADWGDEPGSDKITVRRKEMDLDSTIPAWRE